MTKYLYGASVQGIQGFIFETNKLREIAGASQLVDNISSINWNDDSKLSEFEKYCEPFHKVVRNNIVMSAAGNIKYKVEVKDDKDEETLKKIVLGFPKYIANYAPGITISQAVVEIEDENDIQKSINSLEEKLKSQRNIVSMPIETGFMGLERARRTGGVAFYYKEGEDYQDRAIFNKSPLKDRKGKNKWLVDNKKLTDEDTLSLFKKFTHKTVKPENVPFDLAEITKQAENNSWIAIIHADGNGLGNILTNMSKKVEPDKREEAFTTFSKQLDVATESAAKIAFSQIIPELKEDKEHYPIRPVVLGGDDLTVIIRADLAYDFTKAYLKAFEEETSRIFKKELSGFMKNGAEMNGLTACAGITFIKDSYPFHYGIHLAEELTGEAKKLSKSEDVQKIVNRVKIPSSLSFYKVQSSFTEDLKEMKKRTQFTGKSNVRFDYGPYFIDEIDGFACVKELDEKLEIIQKHKTDKSKGVSKLRQYISELYIDESKSEFLLNRMSKVNKAFYDELKLESERKKDKMILNDLIQLHTFKEAYHEN